MVLTVTKCKIDPDDYREKMGRWDMRIGYIVWSREYGEMSALHVGIHGVTWSHTVSVSCTMLLVLILLVLCLTTNNLVSCYSSS